MEEIDRDSLYLYDYTFILVLNMPKVFYCTETNKDKNKELLDKFHEHSI